MKLSNMSTDKAFDALTILAPEIESLINDNDFVGIMKNRKKSDNKDEAKKLGTKTLMDAAIYLLKNKKPTIFSILGALDDKTIEEISEQSITKTLSQIMEMATDKELLDFFQSFAKLGQETQ